MSGPQYAKSSDPRVIAAVESRNKAHDDLAAGGKEFARKYSGEDATPSFHQGIGGRTVLTAVQGPRPVGHGHWKPVYAGWRPSFFNPVRKEMLSVRSRLIDVPGMPRSFESETHENGARAIMFPKVFVLDGVAWFSLGEPPAAVQQEGRYMGYLDLSIWAPVTSEEWSKERVAWLAT